MAQDKDQKSYVAQLRESAVEQRAESAAAARLRARRQRAALESQRQAALGRIRAAARKEGRKAVLPGYWGTAAARERAMMKEQFPTIQAAVVEVGAEVEKAEEEELALAEKAIAEWQEERLEELRKDNVELASGEWVNKAFLEQLKGMEVSQFALGAGTEEDAFGYDMAHLPKPPAMGLAEEILQEVGIGAYGEWSRQYWKDARRMYQAFFGGTSNWPDATEDMRAAIRDMHKEAAKLPAPLTPPGLPLFPSKAYIAARVKVHELARKWSRKWAHDLLKKWKVKALGFTDEDRRRLIKAGGQDALDAAVDTQFQQYLKAVRTHYDNTGESLSIADWRKSK